MEEQWDVNNMEKMRDDSLILLRILFIDLFKNKYAKVVIAFTLSFHIPLWGVQFYYFATNFNLDDFALYGPCSLAFLYAFMSMLVMIYVNEKIKDYKDVLKSLSWSLNTCSEVLKGKIIRHSYYMNYVCIGNLVLGLITYAAAIARINSNYIEIIYQVVFIEEQFPKHAFVLKQIFGASLFIFIIPMIAVVHLEAYFLIHVIFQIRILCEKVGNITKPYENIVNLISDETYQEQVFNRLRFCIIRSGQLQSFSVLGSDIAPKVVVTYIVLCMLLLVCYLGGYYLNVEMYVPLLSSIIIVSCYTCLVGFEVGQMLEEESLNFYDVMVALPWYTFDNRNRKMLLFVMLHAAKPTTLSPYEMFPLSRKSIVQLYKAFTTLSAFLAKTRDGMSL